MPSESCVSVRAMVRRSKRAIDPEFDAPRDTLVSFVDPDDGGGPSLLLAPVPLVPTRARSLSRGNMAPMKRRHRSFGAGSAVLVGGPGSDYARKPSAGSSLHSSGNTAGEGGSVTSDGEDRMVDVSLEEGPGGDGGRGEEEAAEALNTSLGSAGDPLSLSHRPRSQSQPLLTADRLTAAQHSRPAGLPVGPSGTGNALGGQKRYASPFAVHRTTSGSSSIVSSTHSDTHLGTGSVRSRTSSRSRSRSRSARRMGGHLRMRSLGAASAFAAAASPTGPGEDEGDNGEGETPEPITIPLKDILSVDEEIPSQRKGSSGGGGSRAGGSDFFSSAASDVDAAAKAVGDERAGGATSALHPHPTSPPPSSTNGHGNGKVPYRIFLHTLGNGYVECSLDSENSHDVFLAYLKAHLAPDRVPDRTHPHQSGHHHHVAGGLRTMVLTPTKEVPSALGSSSRTLTKGDDNDADTTTTPARSPARSVRSLSSRPAIVSRSRTGDSTVDGSRDIDRLHSRAIKKRLQAEATPFMQFKERVAAALSSMMDCACCQDTTVAPLEEERSKNHSLQTSGSSKRQGSDSGGEEEDRVPSMKAPQQRSPTSQRLWGKGIGGLSFEESCASAPKLSFEKSMDRG